MIANKMDKDSKENEIEESFDEDDSQSCESCGGQLESKKVNLEEFEGGKLYLMENVTAHVCEHCGEMWVPEPTLKEFEKMMQTAINYHARKKSKKYKSRSRNKKK